MQNKGFEFIINATPVKAEISNGTCSAEQQQGYCPG
jgi:hypothetical protein